MPVRTPRFTPRTVLAALAGLALAASTGHASHMAGVRGSITNVDAASLQVDIDVTAYFFSEGRRGGDGGSSRGGGPTSGQSLYRISWGDGAVSRSVTTSLPLGIVGSGPSATTVFRGSFSHVYPDAQSRTIRLLEGGTATQVPVTGYLTSITDWTGGNGTSTWGYLVANTIPVSFGGGTPCAYNPFHGFLDDGDCLPLCVGHPFHPELFANVPCLAGCSLDETGAVVGSCTRIDAQPPAGSGGDPLAACLVYHPPADCQGLASSGNTTRQGFAGDELAAGAATARGSSGGGCAVTGPTSAAGSALGLGFVVLGLALARRRPAA